MSIKTLTNYLEIKRNIIAGVILAIVCFVTYSNSLHNGFMMDDEGLILRDNWLHNPKFFYLQLIPDNTQIIRAGSSNIYYRPMAHLVPGFCYLLFKTNPLGYHIVNLFLFYLCCYFLFKLIYTLSKDWGISFLTALLFSVHPINGMFVNYITANVYGVQVLSMELSIICFLKAYEIRKNIFTFLSLTLFIVSILCHEISLVFPAYLVCILFFIKNESIKKIIPRCLPYLIVAVLYFIFRLQFASLKSSIFNKIPEFHISVGSYLATFTKLIWWHFTKLFTLQGIVLIWATPPLRDNLIFWCFGFIGLIILSLYVIINYRKWKLISLAICWYIVGFLPVSFACFFQPKIGLMIEPHWLFFGSIGCFLLFSSLLIYFYKFMPKQIWGLIVIVILSTLIMGSRRYNDLWGNELKYCQHWLQEVPGYKNVMFYLAAGYEKNKEHSKAQIYYQKSLDNNYFDWQIYNNLGLLDYNRGDLKGAINYFDLALQSNPRSGEVYNNLGIVFLKEKDLDKAQKAFFNSIKHNPYVIEPRLNLANIYKDEGKIDEAVQLYEQNRSIDPTEQRSRYCLVELYLQNKDKAKAFSLANEALEMSSDAKELTNYGSLLAQNRLNKMAVAFLKKALKRNPKNAEAYLELGKIYGNAEKFDQAIVIWQEGSQKNPGDQRFAPFIKQAEELKESLAK